MLMHMKHTSCLRNVSPSTTSFSLSLADVFKRWSDFLVRLHLSELFLRMCTPPPQLAPSLPGPPSTWSCAEFLAHPVSPYWEWHHVTWNWALSHFLLAQKSWKCTRKQYALIIWRVSKGDRLKILKYDKYANASGKNHNLSLVLSQRHVWTSDTRGLLEAFEAQPPRNGPQK